MEIIVDLKGNVYKERIVRCKECRNLKVDQYGDTICELHDVAFYADDFCSYGEREGE